MEFRIGIEKYDTNKYSVHSIEYIRGVLHCLAELNQPDSNLMYEYEIVEFDKSDDIIGELKKRFYIFENQQLELLDITQESFLEILKIWLTNNGELSKLNPSKYKVENQINHFFLLLKEILNIHKIFKIKNLKSENEINYLELGVDYDYLILNSTDKNYILYFTFSD